ncbi:MAG: hypothetical protein U5K56_08370 [Halioglobus sp.]|nr:hypothetical protein [Halioglobus sp.]
MDNKLAADMSISVMSAEYQIFHKFLDWENYNALACGEVAMLTMKQVEARWQNVLLNVFSGLRLIKVSIPLFIDHKEYQEKINSMVREEFSK